MNIFSLGDAIKCNNNFYTILKKLGNGGSGAAYLCICTNGQYPGCYFVVKVFYQLDKPDRLKRFKKEINFLKTCNHPSIIKFYEDGVHKNIDKEYPFYVMEYMPNTLQNELVKGALSIEKTFMYMTQILSALTYLKQNGIVHRDIKPENIFINGSRAILGDFGLMKEIKMDDEDNEDDDIECLTESIYSDISIGDAMPFNYRTPQLVSYMNNKTPIDYKSDLFQFGITVVIMFTGKNPIAKVKEKGEPVKFVSKMSTLFYDIKKTKHGDHIYNIVNGMINLDESKIKEPEKILSNSTITFRNFLKSKKDLYGNILL